MEGRFKSGRSLAKEHRHDNYRRYNRLVKTLRKYEDFTDEFKILFRSKYTEEELTEALKDYNGDDPGAYLQTKKDSQFRDFLIETSRVESRSAHSCMVIRSHVPHRGDKPSHYRWMYHSLEEYLTEIYNNGDDFVLYVTHLRDVVLKREDEFEYLVPVLSAGEMMVRAMRHDPLRRDPYRQEFYMMYTLVANQDLYGDCRYFTDVRQEGGRGKKWTMNKLRRIEYTSTRKYKGEE